MTELQPNFEDRLLNCADCHGEFIFTAGEQLFFHDKQFKNDPKRCKPCKSRRSGLAAVANGTEAAMQAQTVSTLTEVSEISNGSTLTAEAAVLAAAVMASASPLSSVATAADLASIAGIEPEVQHLPSVPAALLNQDHAPALLAAAELPAESPES